MQGLLLLQVPAGPFLRGTRRRSIGTGRSGPTKASCGEWASPGGEGWLGEHRMEALGEYLKMFPGGGAGLQDPGSCCDGSLRALGFGFPTGDCGCPRGAVWPHIRRQPDESLMVCHCSLVMQDSHEFPCKGLNGLTETNVQLRIW